MAQKVVLKLSAMKSIQALLLLLTLIPTHLNGCIYTEREALLMFKQGLTDPRNSLSSWTSKDCCTWTGVHCDNRTGHIVRLDLHNDDDVHPCNWSLGGQLNPSLIALKHLRYLDLSSNCFIGVPIPEFIGSFQRLKYLNLSAAGFSGTIPNKLGNLSSLRYLDLSDDYSDDFALRVDNGRWLSRLSSLEHLDMSGVDLGRAKGWLNSINMLPSLIVLHLSNCGLPTLPLPLPHINMSSLSELDLSFNIIHSTVPRWVFNITNLQNLLLGGNMFSGVEGGPSIPCKLQSVDLSNNMLSSSLSELAEIFSGCISDSLERLDLSHNKLSGYLPEWLWGLKNLKDLRLAFNSICGPIPTSIAQLTGLVALDIGFNSFDSVLSEAHLTNLVELRYLRLNSRPVVIGGKRISSLNSILLNISTHWVPKFQLYSADLRSCRLGPFFPLWLRTQDNLSMLDLSDNGILGPIPEWFWNKSSQIVYLDLSRNAITGNLTQLPPSIEVFDISFNNFSGPIVMPPIPSNTKLLDLSHNSFSGHIPPNIGETMPNMFRLSLSGNKIEGTIPSSLCKLNPNPLLALDLSDNQLEGEIPSCWEIICLRGLYSLRLSNNHLSGEFPLPLKRCKNLTTLDLSQNKFTGIIPGWLGKSLLSLKILRLRSNMFISTIPSELSNLILLHILDLADNNLSGSIPSSFGNFKGMKDLNKSSVTEIRITVTSLGSSFLLDFERSMPLVIKGREDYYDTCLLPLVTEIDLSGNNLSGKIPEELTELIGLRTLNLSNNHLTGGITERIGALRLLETLDLSRNELSGPIPSSLSALSFLAHLNLSYNNMSGRVPMGWQLQALPDPFIYIGNDYLCGFPLSKKCLQDESSSVLTVGGEEDEMGWFYLCMGLGFLVGFWAFCGTLLWSGVWRNAYFHFFDEMYDKIYIAFHHRHI